MLVKPIVRNVYRFRSMNGWDVERGWPTRARLYELDLEDVYGPMVEGAAKAQGANLSPTTISSPPIRKKQE
jgi:hypothetical protein